MHSFISYKNNSWTHEYCIRLWSLVCITRYAKARNVLAHLSIKLICLCKDILLKYNSLTLKLKEHWLSTLNGVLLAHRVYRPRSWLLRFYCIIQRLVWREVPRYTNIRVYWNLRNVCYYLISKLQYYNFYMWHKLYIT